MRSEDYPHVAQHQLDDPHWSVNCVAADHCGRENPAYLEICRFVSVAFSRYIAYEPDIEITDKLQTARARPTISWCSYLAVCIFSELGIDAAEAMVPIQVRYYALNIISE